MILWKLAGTSYNDGGSYIIETVRCYAPEKKNQFVYARC